MLFFCDNFFDAKVGLNIVDFPAKKKKKQKKLLTHTKKIRALKLRMVEMFEKIAVSNIC